MFVHARTKNSLDAKHDLLEALARVNLESETLAGEPDLALRTGSKVLHIDIKHSSAPSAATVEHLVAKERRSDLADRLNVLVADRLSSACRARLREAGWGWLDRRGHLRIWAPQDGIRVETDIPPLRLKRIDYEDPLSTTVGLEVAIALLLEPGADVSVRALARRLDRAPSAVSTTLKRLREASLVNNKLEQLIPDLFNEVASHWAPHRIPLAGQPKPGEARSLERLQFNLHDPMTPGWALTDTLAASYYGAPLVASSGYPPDFYVPSERILRDAINYFGFAPSYGARACTISVAPVRAAVTTRVDRSPVANTELLLAHPVFVALELARDPGRGREILDQWNPPGEYTRVW